MGVHRDCCFVSVSYGPDDVFGPPGCITTEENESVVSEFLRNNSEFELIPCLNSFGSEGIGLREARRFYPHQDQTAGYFVAKIQRSQ